jgi:uracil-DNA glycosylase
LCTQLRESAHTLQFELSKLPIHMSTAAIPAAIADALSLADASWHSCLRRALAAVAQADPDYLPALAATHYLPTRQRLFAAFVLPMSQVRYVLVGEGPYPREESATGVCFMDGAVGELWCANGLSKPVNRATSLRNFMKMLLVADGKLTPPHTNGDAMAAVAASARAHGLIQTLAELQENMMAQGFLLLNASLVYRPDVAPAVDARAWQPFLQTVLETLGEQCPAPPTLVLWGKIAEQLKRLPVMARLAQVVSEHPYNLSFIQHGHMQALFGPMHLLRACSPRVNRMSQERGCS